jgi:hypothetical protein
MSLRIGLSSRAKSIADCRLLIAAVHWRLPIADSLLIVPQPALFVVKDVKRNRHREGRASK